MKNNSSKSDAGNTLIKTMKEKAEAVQAKVAFVKNVEEAVIYAADLTLQQTGSTIAAVGLDETAHDAMKRQCSTRGLQLLGSGLRTHAENIHTAFSFADWGIAETGTIVMDATPEDTRIATMMAETHVALLPVSRLRADAFSVEDELAALQKQSPRYMAFITGASRTADIERVLTIGVHGPCEFHLLIMEDNVI